MDSRWRKLRTETGQDYLKRIAWKKAKEIEEDSMNDISEGLFKSLYDRHVLDNENTWILYLANDVVIGKRGWMLFHVHYHRDKIHFEEHFNVSNDGIQLLRKNPVCIHETPSEINTRLRSYLLAWKLK